MPRGLSLLALVLPGLLAGCSIFGGDDEQVAQLVPARLPKPSDFTESSLLEQFAAPASEYRLGPGDKLTITVWGRPEISGPQTVGPDGQISVPVGGSLLCSNLTREETEQAITTVLMKYYTQVSVTVRVDEYLSNRVSVLGNVEKPGSFTFTGPPTLLGALSEAGGLADRGNIVMSPRCSIIRGRTQIVWIDLSELLWHGNIGLNIPLQRDDIVYVPDGTGVMVYVLGEVKNPGVMRLTPGMSLVDAIALAGGMTEDALVDGIRVLRPAQPGSAEVDFEEFFAGDLSQNAELREGDIIYVPTRKLEKWNYFWRKINPFSGFFTVQQA